MNRGWWRFYRKMISDSLWEAGRERTKFEAWVDLLSRAKGRPGREIVGYSSILLERGQLIFSIKGLAKDWNWGRGKVRRFLSYLENEGQISVNRSCSAGVSKPDTKMNTPFWVITITNYERYNPLHKKADTQTDIKRTPSGHQADTSNKGIKRQKEKNSLKSPPPGAVQDISQFFTYHSAKCVIHKRTTLAQFKCYIRTRRGLRRWRSAEVFRESAREGAARTGENQTPRNPAQNIIIKLNNTL